MTARHLHLVPSEPVSAESLVDEFVELVAKWDDWLDRALAGGDGK